jgi:ATP-binding cassette subfamily C protein
LVVLASKIGIQGGNNILPLLGLYAYAGFRIMPSLNRVLISLQSIKFGVAALRDVHTDFGILASGPATGPAIAAEKPIRFKTELTLHGISFAYPMTERRALHDIEFSIRRGESVGIVGSTGAGKSTLLDIILGLLEPDAGELLVDGKSIKNDMGRWQRLVGYVPQMVFLLDDSLKRNIALGVPDNEIDQSRVNAVIRTTQLEDVVAGLPAGIDTVVGERGIRLSGGQRQRVAIARALYHRPEVLVLDEATAALDNRTELYLSEAVQKLSGAMTLVIVAHRLNTIRHCNRVVVMQDGAIVDIGGYDELMARSVAFRDIAAHAIENKG